MRMRRLIVASSLLLAVGASAAAVHAAGIPRFPKRAPAGRPDRPQAARPPGAVVGFMPALRPVRECPMPVAGVAVPIDRREPAAMVTPGVPDRSMPVAPSECVNPLGR